MLLRHLWERHFFYRTAKVFLFCSLCFALLYILIDYSTHAKAFHHSSLHGGQIALYYAGQLAIVLPQLAPFSLLLATLNVLLAASTHRETVALMTAGIARSTLITPALLLSMAVICCLYVDEQFVIPTAAGYTNKVNDSYTAERRKGKYVEGIKQLPLSDQSFVFFRKYNREKNTLQDALWLRSIDDLWKVEELPLEGGLLLGSARHFVRDDAGFLTLEPFPKRILLPAVHLEDPDVWTALINAHDLPLQQLWQQHTFLTPKSDKEAFIATALYYKVAAPWLCLFVILIPAPSCLLFSRRNRHFALYACSLFGLVTVSILMDAAQLLAKRQVIPPLWAIGLPMALLFSVALWRYLQLKKSN